MVSFLTGILQFAFFRLCLFSARYHEWPEHSLKSEWASEIVMEYSNSSACRECISQRAYSIISKLRTTKWAGNIQNKAMQTLPMLCIASNVHNTMSVHTICCCCVFFICIFMACEPYHKSSNESSLQRKEKKKREEEKKKKLFKHIYKKQQDMIELKRRKHDEEGRKITRRTKTSTSKGNRQWAGQRKQHE